MEKCRNFFRKFVPADCKLTEAWDGSGTAKAMKRIVESYGFSFKRTGNGVYKAEKRTPRNAVIYTELYAAEENAYLVVSFQSVAVKHELYCNMEIPSQNKGVINAHLKDAFAAIGEFEKTFLPGKQFVKDNFISEINVLLTPPSEKDSLVLFKA